jgi:hypothetical protein
MPTFIGNSYSSLNLQQESHTFKVGNNNVLSLTGSAVNVNDKLITNVATPVSSADAANKEYVDTAISNLVAGAGSSLDTLNELANALNNDANFSTTVVNSIATKVASADFNSLFAARLIAEDLTTATYVATQIANANSSIQSLQDGLTRYQWLQAQYASMSNNVVVFQNLLQPGGNASKKIVMGANNNQFTVQVGLYCVRMNLACVYLGDNDVPARMLMLDAANTVMMQLKGSRAIDNVNVVTNETCLIINVTVP